MKRGQVLLWATIAFIVLFVVDIVSLGTAPEAGDSGDEVVKWFRDNGTHVHISLLFLVFALVAFAVYATLIRGALPAAYRDLWFFGSIVVGTTTMVQAWTLGGLSLHPAQLQPATARNVLDVAIYFGPLLTAATITMLVSVVILGFRGYPGIPTWLAVLSLVTVVEQAIETVTIFGSKGFTAPGGPMNLQLGAGLFLITTLALGVTMSRRMDDAVAQAG
jgi:hypothetical protein